MKGTVMVSIHWFVRMGCAVPLILLAATRVLPAASSAISEFRVVERFGVSHPDQIIDFDLTNPVRGGDCAMVDERGREVPFQFIEDGRKVAVRAELAAGGTRQWTLVGGRKPQPYEQGVRVVEGDAGWEIGNEFLAVRLPRFAAGSSGRTPAPIQGMRLRDGTWTGGEPGFITFCDGMPDAVVRSAETRFAERGPLIVVAEVVYTLDRPEMRYGETVIAPKGPGLYVCRIRVQAGQPSILIEEETDTQFSYPVNLGGLKLDQARYRGHHASDVRFGREPDGGIYRPWHMRSEMDATFDLPFDRDYAPAWSSDAAGGRLARLAIWNPWIVDCGWYLQLYGRDGTADAPLLGLFAGAASRARDVGQSGVGLHIQAATRAVGLTLAAAHRGDDGRIYPRPRFQWGLFVGTKGDLASPEQVQPIARQMNLHAGVNLNKVHRLSADFPDPPQGYGSPFMTPEAVRGMVERLQAGGQDAENYRRQLIEADPGAKELVEFWADASGGKAKVVAKGITDLARDLLDSLVQGDGIYTFRFHYWHGGLEMSRKLMWIDQVLGSPLASAQDKAQVKAAAVLLATVLWDDDFVPLDNHGGINLGTPNMPVQQSGFRDQYALLLASHPDFQSRAASVADRVAAILAHDLNEHGAHIGSVHYIGAGMGPTLTLMQQLQRAGHRDFFRDEPRVAKFAEFLMQCATPPEPRFGNLRKQVSFGDGSTESSELFGQLGTGFAPAWPDLSGRLMDLWRRQGRTHSSFHGTTLLKIDESLSGESSPLASGEFPGYFTVLRHGAGTPQESAVWLLTGNHYVDHCHADEGGVVIYALGAPVSLDWGSMYSPRVAGCYMHSLALPERLLGHRWDQDGPPIDTEPWGNYAGTRTTIEAFGENADGGWVRSRMVSPDRSFMWTRAISMMHPGPDVAVVAIQDSFEGSGADGARIFSLPLTAEGEVQTPAGRIRPTERIWGSDSRHGDKQEMPSAGEVFKLGAGVQRLGFTGQRWPAHWAGGVDWDVFILGDEPVEGAIGNWAHAWHPGSDAHQYELANGRSFEERQHILRLRSRAGFRVVLVAWPKGREPQDLRVVGKGEGVQVNVRGRSIEIAAGGDWKD